MNVLSIKDGMKKIKLISEAGKKLDERIHAVGVAGVAHFLQCGDTTLISELVHAMPRSARGNALKFWITKHLKTVKWDANSHGGKGGYKGKMPQIHSFEKIKIVMEAEASPFFEKEDKEASVWNEGRYLATVLSTLKRHNKEHPLSEEGAKAMALVAGVVTEINNKSKVAYS